MVHLRASRKTVSSFQVGCSAWMRAAWKLCVRYHSSAMDAPMGFSLARGLPNTKKRLADSSVW